MSGHHPPIRCRDFKAILKKRGFSLKPVKRSGGSHEQWVGYVDDIFRKVTIDCSKSPFTQKLIRSMAAQAGIPVEEIYRLYREL